MEKKNVRKSLKDIAYTHIKNLILDSVLLPGDVIDEKELANQLEVSRTPIREAIQKLQEEKLIHIMPRRGTVVSHISIADIHQLYEARKMIEPEITKLAIFTAKEEDLLEFRNVFEQQKNNDDVDEDWDSKFHLYLAQITRNEIIQQWMRGLMLQSARIRALSNRGNRTRLTYSKDEHIRIIDALLAKDAELASQYILHHLERSEEGYKNLYENSTYFSI